MELQQPARKTWLWITGAPLLLMLLMVIAGLLNLPVPFDGSLPIILGFSLLVGVVSLLALIVLRIKRRIAFSQTAMWVSLVLASLDIAIPVGIVAFLYYVLTSLHF